MKRIIHLISIVVSLVFALPQTVWGGTCVNRDTTELRFFTQYQISCPCPDGIQCNSGESCSTVKNRRYLCNGSSHDLQWVDGTCQCRPIAAPSIKENTWSYGDCCDICSDDPNVGGSACYCGNCERKESCNDGIDNDGNGQFDEGCGGTPACNDTLVGEPIHIQSGNMSLHHTDASIQTGGIPLSFTRYYNSNYSLPTEVEHAHLSVGWRHNYQSRIVAQPNGNGYVVLMPGSQSLSFSSFNSGYVPQKGSGGNKFELETVNANPIHFALTTGEGTTYRYDYLHLHLVSITDRTGHKLELEYATHTTNGQTKYYLKNVVSKVKGATEPGMALYFHYEDQGNNQWHITKLARVQFAPPLPQGYVSKSCFSQSSCSSGEICAMTPGSTTGYCGEYIAGYSYDTTNYTVIELSKADRDPSDPTKHFISYEYTGKNVSKALLTKAKDAEGRILEEHTYDNTGRALTSKSRNGEITLTYNSNNTTTVTNGTTGSTQTLGYDNMLSRVTSSTGSCGCSTNQSLKSWTESNGYILLKSAKENGKQAYTTYNYAIDATTGFVKQEVVTYGDNDDTPSSLTCTNCTVTTPSTNSAPTEARVVTTYFHPTFPALKTAISEASVNPNATNKKLIIYDYDNPLAPPSGYCAYPDAPLGSCGKNVADYNIAPTGTLHRIILVGYTNIAMGSSSVSWAQKVRVIKFTYHTTHGYLLSVSGPALNQETTFSYHNFNSTNYNSYKLHEVKQKVYNPLTTSTVFLTTKYTNYNALGLPQRISKPVDVNATTELHKDITYNALGQTTQIQEEYKSTPSSSTITMQWILDRDKAGMLKTFTHPNGNITHYEYDTYTRTKKISIQENSSATIKPSKEYTYDAGGNITAIKNLLLKDTQSNPLQHTFSHVYNGASKTTTHTLPPPYRSSRTYTYNPNGTLDQITDEKGYFTKYHYHSLRHWVLSIDRQKGDVNDKATTSYTYDKHGNVAIVTDPINVQTTHTYDDFGQLVRLESPDQAPDVPGDSKVRLYVYDANGNKIQQQRSDGSVVQYTYDTLNRLLKVDYPSPTNNPGNLLADGDITYTYDNVTSHFASGRVSSVSVQLYKNPDSGTVYTRETTYHYDSRGRRTEEVFYDSDSSSQSWSTKYTYDLAGRMTSIKYPTGTLEYVYTRNQFGQITRIEDQDPGYLPISPQYWLYATYNTSGGLLRELKYAYSSILNDTPTVYVRRFSGDEPYETPQGGTPTTLYPRKTRLLVGNQSLLHIMGMRVNEYDERGMVTVKGTNEGLYHLEYSYDPLGRLTRGGVGVTGNRQYSYDYDANSNRKLRIDRINNTSTTYSYAANRLTSWSKGQTTNNYLRYPDGQRKEDAHRKFIFGPNHRLAMVEPKEQNSNNKSVFYMYDHQGRAVRKLTFSSFTADVNHRDGYTNTFYDLRGNKLEEYHVPDIYDPNTYEIRQWVWLDNKLVSGIRAKTNTDGSFEILPLHFVPDRMGKPIIATDTQGHPVWRRNETEPFGNVRHDDIGHNAYKEVDISSNPIEQNGYVTGQNTTLSRSIVEPGTYAVQFFFEYLDTERGWDFLRVKDADNNNTLLHEFSGRQYLPGAGSGMWGPVLRYKPTRSGYASTGGVLNFHFEADTYSVEYGGYKITKYRLWKISSGRFKYAYPYDTPSQPWGSTWTKTYETPSAKMVRLCFSSFDTSTYGDDVHLKDDSGNIVQDLYGSLGSFCSSWVEGSKVTLYFNKYFSSSGFTVDTVESILPAEINARFPGQWYDKDTESRDSSGVLLARGLHYNWHRFYDPEVGRYISVDPLGLDAGLNVFGYAFGNPTTYVDPDGQIPTALKLLVTAIVGLALYIFGNKSCTNKDGKNKDGKNMADKAMVDKAIDKTKESKNLVNEKYEKLIKVLCFGRNDTDEAKINCLASNGKCDLLKYKYKQLQAKERNSQLYSDERLEGLLISCERAAEKFRPSYPFKKWKKRW